jgi:hypothetical protein
MPSTTPNSPIEEKIFSATRTPAPRPEFLAALSARLQNQASLDNPAGLANRPRLRGFSFSSLFRPAWVAALVTLLVLVGTFLAIGPQRVMAAMGNLFGYVPGIGLVQGGTSLRVLASPTQVERDGITLFVEQGAADRQRTVIVYRVEGLSLAAANSHGEGAVTGGLAVLVLPDGSILTQNGGGMTGWGTGYQARLEFPPVPENVHESTLLIQRLDSMPSGAAPEDWRLPVQWKPAPADLKMMPVYELSTPVAVPPAPAGDSTAAAPGPSFVDATATPNQASIAATTLPLNETSQNGVQLKLERVIELPDGYQLEGSLNWNSSEYSNVSFNAAEYPFFTLKDANDQSILYQEADPSQVGGALTGGSQPWAIRTNMKGYPGPWQLSVNHLVADQPVRSGQSALQIDFGPDAQIGQSWPLNQDLNVAGRILRAVTATLKTEPRSNGLVLEVTFSVDPAVTWVGIEDLQNQPDSSGAGAGGGGGGGGGEVAQAGTTGVVTARLPYFSKPTGIRQIQISNVSSLLDGPWIVRWEPPAVTGQPTPTQAAQACLTDTSWAQIKSQQAGAIPEDLSGRLIIEENQGSYLPHLALTNLDGSQRKDLTTGAWSDLSPDGKRVAFNENFLQGIVLLDVASGEKQLIAGTQAGDYHPLWSPDGQWLAFNRGNNGVYILRPDGSELRQVADATRIRFLAGWQPDGQGLVITSLGQGGSYVQTINLQTGQIQDHFVINNVKGGFARLSPDGKRLAFSEMIFGLPSYGIYVANLDGTGKRQLAGLETGMATTGAWSPNSRWLTLTVMNSDGENAQALLLQVNTCQALLIPGGKGQVSAWGNSQP